MQKDDVIYKQAVTNALQDEFKKTPTTAIRAINVIRRLSSAQPERMRGKWIKRGGTIYCSICKHCNWSECFEHTVMNFNYCPNCGADMRGEKE